MRKLGLLCVLVGLSSVRVLAANCDVGGTTIFYGNGINNDYIQAFNSASLLKTAIQREVAQDQAIDQSCLGYGLAWNAQVVTTSFPWLNNLIGLVVQAGIITPIQLVAGYASQLWSYVAAGAGAPPSAQQALGVILNATMSVFQPDLQRQVSQYEVEISEGNKVAVVAHSQGNLYVNQAYALISPVAQPSIFEIVAVATPAGFVAGNGPYVTLLGDFINAVSPLVPNSDNGPCGSPIACHSFDASYLSGQNSRPSIINHVIDAIPIPVRVSIDGTGAGRVVSTPAGIACDPDSLTSSPCSAGFARNVTQSITLTATEASGSIFSGWSGTCTTDSQDISVPITLTIAQSCTATFDLASVLVVNKVGTGTGTISSVPNGISCGPSCATQMGRFAATHTVQLTAVFEPGSIFTDWEGDCASGGTAPTVVVDMAADRTCIAKFDLGGVLTINKSGSGSGTVSSVPAGIACGPSCSMQAAPFPATPAVQLAAAPSAGSTFMGWSGACTGTALTVVVNVNMDETCTATFGSLPTVRANPFGIQNLSNGPFQVQVINVVNGQSTPTPAPGEVTVTLRREVISQCSGLLFSSNRTATVLQGQTSGGSFDAAGRDPACNTLPITTRWTVLQAILSPSTDLDLSAVPVGELSVSIVR